ncbi:putative SOS response-associated peptidase YedK [Sphingomonas zeicaulis]|uniref:SOS response-associated peptidase family protein n=1 Tax=Sphingomonas zeicaulis TaxID=1632740 RepID=UPI003D1CA5B9
MSRLHTLMAGPERIAAYFDAEIAAGTVVPTSTSEGAPGVVVIAHRGGRRCGNMAWGFPRHTRAMREQGEPPGRIGLVADLTNPLWDTVIVEPRQRCLIALTHFANPDGVPGEMTRTWFSVAGHPIIAWAGIWRMTDDGPVYAGLTMDANDAIPPTNDRMPLLLIPADHERWLHGSIQDVIAFQFGTPIPGNRMVVERTSARWRSEGLPSTQGALL